MKVEVSNPSNGKGLSPHEISVEVEVSLQDKLREASRLFV